MSATPLRLLLVDDENDFRRACAKWMRQKGYDVEDVASGAEAISKLANSRFDVAVLDINMPGKNGYEVCELLKEQFLPSYVPVLFTSGLMDNEDIMKAFASKEDVDHFAKSVDLDVIAGNSYNLSVSSYVEAKDNRVVTNITELNRDLKTTVAKIDQLRSDIDAIVAEIEA